MPVPAGATSVLPPPPPPTLSKPSSSPPPSSFLPTTPGLINLGNTCFLNAALQSLLHLPPIISLLAHPHTPHPLPQQCPMCALQQLAAKVLRATNAVAPRQFLQVVRQQLPTFRPGRQEDAHEFLRGLLDALVRAEIAGCAKTKAVRLTWQMEQRAAVHGIFGGTLQSSVTCAECGHTSETLEPFLDLSLEINGVQSVQAALAKFCAKEKLGGENKYKCERCKKLVVATKRYLVRRAPQVLALHLKRFDRSRKDGRFIRYGERMEIGEFMQGNGKASYELTAVLVHQGSSRMYGHYFAVVKGGAGWSLKDDGVVREGGALKQRAYILFYTRVGTAGRDEMEGVVPAVKVEKPRVDPTTDSVRRKSEERRKSNEIEKKIVEKEEIEPKCESTDTDPKSSGSKLAAAIEAPPERKPTDEGQSNSVRWEDRARGSEEKGKLLGGDRRMRHSPGLRLRRSSDDSVAPAVELGRLTLHRRHRSEAQEMRGGDDRAVRGTVSDAQRALRGSISDVHRAMSVGHEVREEKVQSKSSAGLVRKKRSKLKILRRGEEDEEEVGSGGMRGILIGGGDAVRKVIRRVFGVEKRGEKGNTPKTLSGKWRRKSQGGEKEGGDEESGVRGLMGREDSFMDRRDPEPVASEGIDEDEMQTGDEILDAGKAEDGGNEDVKNDTETVVENEREEEVEENSSEDTTQGYTEEEVLDEGKGYGNSALFGDEGVNTWDGGGTQREDGGGVGGGGGGERVKKRKRAGDELDEEYDRGKAKKVRQRYGRKDVIRRRW